MTTCTVLDCAQRSPEWYAARLGRLTGSRANDALKTIQKGEAAGRKKLRIQLVLERLTGKPQESAYISPAMQVGMDREFEARELYEALTGTLVEQCGFLQHTELMAGCSLDGFIGDFEGIVEIKAPEPHTHLEYLTTGKVPLEYQRQLLHSFWCSGAQWCDWFSYEPTFPEHLRVKMVRVLRNEAEIAAYEIMVRAFLAEVDRELAVVSALADKAVA